MKEGEEWVAGEKGRTGRVRREVWWVRGGDCEGQKLGAWRGQVGNFHPVPRRKIRAS